MDSDTTIKQHWLWVLLISKQKKWTAADMCVRLLILISNTEAAALEVIVLTVTHDNVGVTVTGHQKCRFF